MSAKKGKKSGKLGRKTKYLKAYDDQIIAHMKQGLSLESFAGVIGVSVDSIYEWAKQNKSFSESVKAARAACLLFWEKHGIIGTLQRKPTFNTTGWIFQMKARFPQYGWNPQAPNPGPEDQGFDFSFEDEEPGEEIEFED